METPAMPIGELRALTTRAETIGATAPADAVALPALLRVSLIGPMQATGAAGTSLLPKGRKSRALLAILAMAAPHSVLREQVTALLWSTREREQARASLRQSVHEVQEMLEAHGVSVLRSVGQALQLGPDRVWVDVLAITHATAAGADALDLLKGGLLEDLRGLDPAFDLWIAATTQRVREAAARLAAHMLDRQTEPEAVIVAARRLVGILPRHEDGWRRLIQAHVELGERGAAIEAYDACARALGQPAGGEAAKRPSDETSGLVAQLRDNGAASDGLDPRRRDRGTAKAILLGVTLFRTTDPLDEAMLSVGLAEEITTALSRFRGINLIALGTVTPLGAELAAFSERWRQLGLDFLMDGVIQRSGGAQGRVRVSVRLLDMRAGGEVVWSSRYERSGADLFLLQDEIAAETAAQVVPELMMHESRRVAASTRRDGSAYELMLRAIPEIYRLAQPGYGQAGLHLEAAAARAPEDATIHAWWACWFAFLVGQGWADNPKQAMARAGELADRAVALDPGCARALSVAGYVRSFVLHKDIGETIGLHDRALALNPNLPFAWAVSALSLAYAGHHATAVARGHQARRLSPLDPHSFFFDSVMMVPHLMLGEFEAVVELGYRSLALNPTMSATAKGLLSALGHLGRMEQAATMRAKLERLEPGFTLADAAARSPLRRVEDLQMYIEGLRLAGLDYR